MTDKSDRGHNPSARSLARWETEGGATKNRRLKRPRDSIAPAKLIGDIATGQVEDRVEDKRNPAAVSPERRKQIAAKAARKRWAKK